MVVHALLADGRIVAIRPALLTDVDAVRAMFERMSPDHIYLRFFNFSRLSAQTEALRVCDLRPGRVALLAMTGEDSVTGEDTVAGVASYDVTRNGDGERTAEVAFAVADDMHHKGIATLLLEHLVSAARAEGVAAFTAQTLPENTPMLRVFADAGLPVQQHLDEGVVEVKIPLPADDTGTVLDSYLDTVARRERAADAASLRHVFAPESVVVIGASRRRGTAGRAILDNIRTAGYAGRLYAVNPRAHQVGGVHCVPSVADLPEAPDLALIAVPPPAVLGVAEDCGKLGVKALTVITSGLDTAASADLLASCRRHGMRLVGPNCFGVAVPGIGLDATFAASHPRPGTTGLVTQSGGLGFAVADQLSRLGIGISSFASVGNKLDVSSNDLLLWWEQDGTTKLAVLYIESFGNPRKFARTARRVSAAMPVLTVHTGQPVRSRTLFEQAGIIVAPGFGELIETAAFLATQPVPARGGRTVAIVTNVGGAGVLTADACTDLGLSVYQPHGLLRRKLRTIIPDSGAVTGPVDTTAALSSDEFRQILELIAADPDVDAMIALVLPTAATGDLEAAIREADLGRVPLAAVVLSQAESVRLLDGPRGRIPAYAYPESAAGALARAARYGAWRAKPHAQVPVLPGVRTADAHAIVREYLNAHQVGGWLPPAQIADLLGCYGIPLVPLTSAAGEDAVVTAAAGIDGPVVLKADVPGLVHKTDAGAVELDLRTDADVRNAWRRLRDRFGARLDRVLVQPMISGGTEAIIGVTDDHMFGPLVTCRPGGLADDRSARFAPLTVADADTLIRAIPGGALAVDLTALRDLLLRVSRLADDLPEITDLDLNPVIARPDGMFAVDARVKVAPYEAHDPFLRKLR